MDYYNNETILEQASEIESLRQQLVSVTKERDEIAAQARMLDRMVDERDEQLAAALAACELQHEALIDTVAHLSAATSAYEKFVGRHGTRGRADALFSTRYADFISAEKRGREALAIKPDASALKAHDEALIERCLASVAVVANKYSDHNKADYNPEFGSWDEFEEVAAAIRELKDGL